MLKTVVKIKLDILSICSLSKNLRKRVLLHQLQKLMFNMVENKLTLSYPRQPIPLAERVSSVIKKSHLEERWLPAKNNPLTTACCAL